MKLRPITLMAVLMAVGVLIVGLVAWRHHAGSVAAGQPGELPIRTDLAGPAAAALAPASTIGGDGGAVTYVAAAGLPALDGTAHAWRLAPSVVTSDIVNRLADALGLSGSVVAQSDGWTVSGSGLRSLTVTRDQPAGPWTWTMSGVAVSAPAVCAVPMGQPAIGVRFDGRFEGHRAGSERAGGHLGRWLRGAGHHRARCLRRCPATSVRRPGRGQGPSHPGRGRL